ncbi:OsmC family protein [Marinobacterium litorale]|jgi:uncharacterized OsmC-like protein|uniref:OsmC family protein n=1 Tax=Marinobacterium litorale TaxID=404770 RepID=UPI0004190E1E|nr:OsmC family protein [Marinobacterium litorale]
MPSKKISVVADMGAGFAIETDIRGHQLVIDQPKAGGGTDRGPSPLEYFLFSLAGCVASIGRIAASQQKLNLRNMRVTVEGDLNPDGLLGKQTDDRVGFQNIEIIAEIDADLSDEEKQAFLDDICARCPLHDNIHYETRVKHELSATGCFV